MSDSYERREKKAERIYNNYRKRAKIGIPLVIAVCICLLVSLDVSYNIGISYQYNNKIGSYIENAYDASTFELMKQNYIMAKQGMINAGLSPNDYGKYFYWEQTSDWQMAYTYQYIDGLISRCDYYINQTQTQQFTQFTDIYNQMISNMRNESTRNGPVDWTAKPAFILKQGAIYYFGTLIWIIVFILAIIAIVLLWLPCLSSEYDIRKRLEEEE